MSVIAVMPARDAHDDVTRDLMQTDGSYFPTGCAGWVHDETVITCARCAGDYVRENGDPIFGDSEWDYPGYTCSTCDQWLDVSLLIYDQGPGSELLDAEGDLPDAAFEV